MKLCNLHYTVIVENAGEILNLWSKFVEELNLLYRKDCYDRHYPAGRNTVKYRKRPIQRFPRFALATVAIQRQTAGVT